MSLPHRSLPLAALLATAIAWASPEPSIAVSALETTAAEAIREEPRTVDEVLAALYSGVSGPSAQARDWATFTRLFVPDARIGVTRVSSGGGVAIQMMSVAEFAALNDRLRGDRGFFEAEIHREHSAFGNVVHVWSAYEARREPTEPPYARGANSLQMVRTPIGWRIAALTWDHERPGQALADRFPVPDRSEGGRR